MSEGNEPEIARKGSLHRVIPVDVLSVDVTAGAAIVDLSAVPHGAGAYDCRGKWIETYAETLAVTVLRGDHTATIAAGSGLVLAADPRDREERFVDKNTSAAELQLTHISTGAAKIKILVSPV